MPLDAWSTRPFDILLVLAVLYDISQLGRCLVTSQRDNTTVEPTGSGKTAVRNKLL